MDFAERAEHRDLRAAVASIASGFGPPYYAQHAAERTPCDDLWTKLGEAGFIGVNILAEYGGGGGGLTSWLHDHGEPAGESANMAKYAAAEAAIAAADAATQTHGGNGFATEYGLMPYWASARLLRVTPVNREMILNYVAQHSLGLPRSY